MPAAKLNCFDLDNPCIAYACNLWSRKMSVPELSDENAVVRVRRHFQRIGMTRHNLQMAAKLRIIFSKCTDSDG